MTPPAVTEIIRVLPARGNSAARAAGFGIRDSEFAPRDPRPETRTATFGALLAASFFLAAAPLRAAPARLAVFPFDAAVEDERFSTLADGLPWELAERLAWDGAWLVTRERLERASEEAGIDSPESLSLASQRELARRAGALWLLSGAAGGDAASVRISLRLLAVDRPLAPVRFEEKVAWNDLPGFLDRAEAALATGLGLPTPAPATMSAGTLELYLRARAENSPVARLGLLQTCAAGGGFPRARALLARALLDNLKPAEAAAAFSPLDAGLGGLDAPLPAGSAGPALARLKGWLEYRNGNSLAAEGWTRKALAAEPDPDGWFLLARVRASLRDRGGALAALDQALALEPAHPGATKLRRKLLDEQAAAAGAASAPAPASGPAVAPAPPPVVSPAPPSPARATAPPSP